MYRILILASAFLLAVAGMLFLQGGETRNPDDLARVDAGALRDVAALSAPTGGGVLQGGSTGANALAAAVAAASGGPVVTPAADDDMENLTSGVLADLGVTQAAPAAADDPMAAMTASVLAGLAGGAPAPAAAEPGPQDLQGLVVQALRQGQSDAYIDLLLNEAASSGQVAVPEALMTAEGKVDTGTLLRSIVAQATAETDALTQQLAAAAGGAAPVARPAVANAAAATPSAGPTYYTVEKGDSLAYISMVFYGSPSLYTKIFEANRATIESPNKIRVGQRLLIPG